MKRIKLSGKYAIDKYSYTIVDDEDYEWLSKHKWKAKPNGAHNNIYAIRTTNFNGKTIDLRMHRLIIGAEFGNGKDVDHINHNSLDNRKSNLRIVDRKINLLNKESKSIMFICEYCYQIFYKKTKTGIGPKYCSKECYSNAKRKKIINKSRLKSDVWNRLQKAYSRDRKLRWFLIESKEGL